MMTPQEFSQVQSNRCAMYRLVENLFAGPLSQGDLDALRAVDLDALSCGSACIKEGLSAMRANLAQGRSGVREAIARDYASAFLGVQSVEGSMALPYESAYEDSSQRLMGSARNAVFNIYKKHALKLDEGIDLPEDHLAFMCEFLAVMALRSSTELLAGDRARACVHLQLSRAFLAEHVLSWFPQMEALAVQVVDEPFYRGALQVADGFFSLDLDVLDSLLAELDVDEKPFDLAWWERPFPAKDQRRGSVRIRRSRCIRKQGDSCSRCASVCPKGLDPYQMSASQLKQECVGCGLCARACPGGALSLRE